jgi:dienelactone hydrolase
MICRGAWRRSVFAALFAATLALSSHARAQTELLPAYDDKPLVGPAKAKGAVIWNHGLSRLSESEANTPFYADALRAAGWDVFKLTRKWASDRVYDSTEALIAEGRKLRAQGYKHLVSAGQSFGGWISYNVAGKSDSPFEAIVATAPAAHGTLATNSNWRLNADNLYGFARDVKPPVKVLSFFFNKDDYDPGGRGAEVRRLLTARGVPNVIVDYPPGFTGHGAGGSMAFALMYGRCIAAFVEPVPLKQDFSCAAYPAAKASFPLPKDLKIAPAPAEAPATLAGMVGRWQGWYDSGRPVMLVVYEVGKDRALAIYSTTAQFRNSTDKGNFTRRRGEFDTANGVLRFTETATFLEYKLRPDGRLDATWQRKSSETKLVTILTKAD